MNSFHRLLFGTRIRNYLIRACRDRDTRRYSHFTPHVQASEIETIVMYNLPIAASLGFCFGCGSLPTALAIRKAVRGLVETVVREIFSRRREGK